ncbi:hypothetical protein SBP18_14395 [Rhodoferax ferrireducens]|uniref:hypothetical protein n=1 Tax=Rhodoferax ferrireducens TaxID=192843 RepID=UPI00298D7471|nr:hypothetical protein [Rhodoferax ferrireducens]WPC65673.1 hypothetical protein SBP18_14395 [Rhodoferax ferrireducens]
MPKQTLPPVTRRAINKLSHQLALAAEARIRERLTIIALAAVETEHAVNLEEMFCKDKSA